jgi:uncharacterized membrane protein (DUF485 family)
MIIGFHMSFAIAHFIVIDDVYVPLANISYDKWQMSFNSSFTSL